MQKRAFILTFSACWADNLLSRSFLKLTWPVSSRSRLRRRRRPSRLHCPRGSKTWKIPSQNWNNFSGQLFDQFSSYFGFWGNKSSQRTLHYINLYLSIWLPLRSQFFSVKTMNVHMPHAVCRCLSGKNGLECCFVFQQKGNNISRV